MGINDDNVDQEQPEERGNAPGLTMLTVQLEGGGKQPKHGGRCINCRTWITAETAAEWSRKVKAPCPNCGKPW